MPLKVNLVITHEKMRDDVKKNGSKTSNEVKQQQQRASQKTPGVSLKSTVSGVLLD